MVGAVHVLHSLLHSLQADFVLADQEAQLDLEDHDTGLREFYALRQTGLELEALPIPSRRGLEVPQSTKWIAICGGSNRLSLIASFIFPNFQVPIHWDRPGKQYQHQNVMSDSRTDSPGAWIDRNIIAPPETKEGQGHYWSCSPRRAEDLYHGISDKDNNSRALFEMWQSIFRQYGIDPSMYMCPSSLPPHTQFLELTCWRVPQEEGRRIQKEMIAHVRIKRPSALYGVAKCWDMARAELETEVRVSLFP